MAAAVVMTPRLRQVEVRWRRWWIRRQGGPTKGLPLRTLRRDVLPTPTTTIHGELEITACASCIRYDFTTQIASLNLFRFSPTTTPRSIHEKQEKVRAENRELARQRQMVTDGAEAVGGIEEVYDHEIFRA